MARVLAYNAPATGHIQPATAVLVELARRGHEVHVRTRASDVAQLAALGFAAAPVDPRIEAVEFDDWQGRNSADALRRLQATMTVLAGLEGPDLRAAIDEVQPDVLLVDVICQGAGFVAEASGLPWVQHCPYPPVFGSKDAPPYGPGLRPAPGPVGRVRDGLVRAIADRISSRHVPALNDLRAELGLEPLQRFDEQHLKPDRYLLFTAEPYEYPRTDWPDSVRLVGPMAWEPPGEVPDWLAEERRPIGLVTASTVRQGDDRLIEVALEALAGDDLAVIVTTGAQDPDQFDVPSGARVERFVPHGPILARAACVVSHGGMGITQKALAAGVPVCVVPFCRDQFEVARRVEVAEAGVRLHHRRLTARRLRRAVAEAMERRAGAEQVARWFAAAGGAPAAADAVEEVLAERAVPTA